MCGIFASNDPRVGQHHLDLINRRLGFRGPDGHSGLVTKGDWKLYHSRLSIIAPREEFSQPYVSEDGDILVFNGEILNFRELMQDYGLPETDSDTAALTALLDVEGFDLGAIDGFFAFVRIDRNGVLTHCARDRFGVKPLFIHRAGQHITVSSEASVLSDLFDLPFSDAAMEEYKVFRAPVLSESYFEDVATVAPGCCTVTGTFFDPLDDFSKSYDPLAQVMDDLEQEISASIRSRMVSDVPVGLLFSGGIDSNLLSCLCEDQLQRFTGGFAGDYDMEFARKRQESDTGQKDTTLIEVSDAEFRQRFTDMVALRKEPLSVPNEVILSFLAEAWAKRGGKVLISGEAADEFFAGYDRIFKWAAGADTFDTEGFLSRYCYVPFDQIPERIVRAADDFFAGIAHLGAFEMVRYFFVKKHLPVLFRRLDFALMFSGVEGREPLASYRMFRMAMRCGPQDLFREDLGKLPLRLLAEQKISTDFAFASKVGFPIDLGRVFHGKPALDRYDNYKIWNEENMRSLK